MITSDELATALAESGPFEVRYGPDYVLLESPEGDVVDSIVLNGNTATWGANDEYTVTSGDPHSLADSILYTQRDAM